MALKSIVQLALLKKFIIFFMTNFLSILLNSDPA